MRIGGKRYGADLKIGGVCQASNGYLPLQSGTNKYASQKGMCIGGVRHVADIKVVELCDEAQTILHQQAGKYR